MRSSAVFLLVVAAAVAGGVVGALVSRPAAAPIDAAAARTTQVPAEIARLEQLLPRFQELLSRLEALARPLPHAAEPGAPAPDVPAVAREPAADPPTGNDAILKELSEQIARLGDQIARLQAPDAARGERLHDAFPKAKTADWAALQDYGLRWRDSVLGPAARGEVLFLDEFQMLDRFGRPTKVNIQTPSGTLWKYSRDPTTLRLGDVYEVKFDLSSAGLVVNPWDVKVVEPTK